MEGRGNNNDMEEITRMLRQLTKRVARIEARRQRGKSYDGERDVYHRRVTRIESSCQHGKDSDGERNVDPFDDCAPLCESNHKEHGTFNYSGCKSSIFNFSVDKKIIAEKEKNSFMSFDVLPKYDCYSYEDF